MLTDAHMQRRSDLDVSCLSKRLALVVPCVKVLKPWVLFQAQCQKELGELNNEVVSKEEELSGAQANMHQQQQTETALQKRITEAERRLQVSSASILNCCKAAFQIVVSMSVSTTVVFFKLL